MILAIRSKKGAPFTRTPSFAALEIPEIIVAGTAMMREQGHATTNTLSARVDHAFISSSVNEPCIVNGNLWKK